MADTVEQLNDLFAIPGHATIPPDILGELQSIERLHSISSQELYYKWEYYSIKMGSEETKLDLSTVRAFKKDVQETLERETRGRANVRSTDKRGLHATPRGAASSDDIFGMLDGLTPNTPRTANGTSKRKVAFETPSVPKVSKATGKSSPTDGRTPTAQANAASAAAFSERQNAGQILETLNGHLNPHEPPIAPPAQPRIRLVANTDLKKFAYKPMAMGLWEASEVLDDRIDEFMTIIQEHHHLEDSAFGSAASKSTNEIIVVGRIASDTFEGKLNSASMVLETSRRAGAGLRVPLEVESLPSHEFFPGQIVALRGINASGKYFSASEVLEIPLMPPAASLPSTLDAINEGLGVDKGAGPDSSSGALNIIVSAGPYTADDNLDYEPLHALCDKAIDTYADALVLIGPLFDIEHPLIATGDFDLPDDPTLEPDKVTLVDAFRVLVAAPLRRLAQEVPNITIVIVPSVRDAVNKHVSWPQKPLPKKELGLPIKQTQTVSNPVTLSLNEILVGISAQDILFDLRREEVVIGKPKESNALTRLPRHVIEQRHFFPLFPPVSRIKSGTEDGLATGMPLDTSYLKLAEWPIRPDLLILPSVLPPFAKTVESVLVVNPGALSKRKAPGTYAQLVVYPRKLDSAERAAPRTNVPHKLFERARVDVIRI